MKYVYYAVVLTEAERTLIIKLLRVESADAEAQVDFERDELCRSITTKLDDDRADAWLAPAHPAPAR